MVVAVLSVSAHLRAASFNAAAPSARQALVALAAGFGVAAEDAAIPPAAKASNALVGDAGGALGALNAAIAESLRPFNNRLTKASFIFSKVSTNDQRAVEVAFSIDYSKEGSKGRLSLNGDLRYSYPDAPNSKPAFGGKIAAKFNLLQILSRNEIDKMGPRADVVIRDLLASYGSKYGDAATVQAALTNKDVDASGHLTGIGLRIALKIDLSKLPAGVDPKSVLFTEGSLQISVDMQGIEIACDAVLNPRARQFAGDERGLKENLDQLLARDPGEMREIAGLVKMLDQFAEKFVNSEPKR